MIEKELIQKAVEVLRNLNKKYYEDSSKKKPLLQDEQKSPIFLQVTLKKIPQSKLIKMIKVLLPHPLIKDSDEVCLIMGDTDKKNHKAEIEPDVLHYKQILEKHGITRISEVVTLRQLRTDYKPYEAKQKLLAAYDMFLADRKIAECLPRVLGRHFFKKRKFPIQIDIKTVNLKQHIEKALSTRVFTVTAHGNSCSSEVAYLDMSDAEIIENVMEVTDNLVKNLPGLDNNISGIYLKTAKSKAIPVYMSYESSGEINLKEEEVDNTVMDELSTFPNTKVKIFSDGSVRTFRLNEDSEAQEVDGADESKESEEEIEQPTNLKKKIKTEPVSLNSEESEEETEKPKAQTKRSKLVLVVSDSEETKKSKSKKQRNITTSIKLNSELEVNAKFVSPGSSLEESGEEIKKSKAKKKNKTKLVSLDREQFETEPEKPTKKIQNGKLELDLEKTEEVTKKSKSKKQKKNENVGLVSVDSNVEKSEKEAEEFMKSGKGTKNSKSKKQKKNENTQLVSLDSKLEESEKEAEEFMKSVKGTKNSKSKKQKKNENAQSVSLDCDLEESERQAKKLMELGKGTKNSKSKKLKKNENTELVSLDANLEESEKEAKKSIKSKKENKKSKSKKQNENEFVHLTASDSDLEESEKETKTSKAKERKVKTESALPDSNQSNHEEKVLIQPIKKVKGGNKAFKKTLDVHTEPTEKGNKSKLAKRKRTESELTSAEHFENEDSGDTQERALKKRKIEGMNMKRYFARKDSRKNKKKENNVGHKK